MPAADAPNWGVRDIAFGLLLYGAAALGVLGGSRLLAQSGLLPAGVMPRELAVALAAALELLMLLPVWLIAVALRRGSWRAVGFRSFNPGSGCLLPPLFYAIALLLQGAWGALIRRMGWETQVDISGLFGTSPIAIAFGFVTVVVIAPLAEETFFRGFVLGGLRKRFGTVGALLLSAALFTLPHPPVAIYPAIFMLGILLGLLYLRTGSLVPAMILHGLNNGIAFSVQVYCALNTCPTP